MPLSLRPIGRSHFLLPSFTARISTRLAVGACAVVLAGCASSPMPAWNTPAPQAVVVPSPAARPVPQPVPAAPTGAVVTPVAPQGSLAPTDEALLSAFSTQLTAMNTVPAGVGPATGAMDAVLDRKTGLLRWRLTFADLSGAPTAAHFHGPAGVGLNAPPVINFAPPLRSPYEGRATLTPAQMTDLLSGLWYVNVHTAARPDGEIRGQLVERR